MRISTRGDYGLRAMIELGLHYGEPPLQARIIAQRHGIPEKYLNQLLLKLRNAGLIESIRGVGGGHRLARPPEQISLYEIIVALEGSTAAAECVEDERSLMPGCDSTLCSFRTVWVRIQEAVDRILKETSLKDLCELERQYAALRQAARKGQPVPFQLSS